MAKNGGKLGYFYLGMEEFGLGGARVEQGSGGEQGTNNCTH